MFLYAIALGVPVVETPLCASQNLAILNRRALLGGII